MRIVSCPFYNENSCDHKKCLGYEVPNKIPSENEEGLCVWLVNIFGNHAEIKTEEELNEEGFVTKTNSEKFINSL